MWRSRVLVLLLAFVLGACGGDGGDGVGGLLVVTTVSPITSIVSDIVGERATIQGIVPEGVNSHTFEPAPSVSELLGRADVVFANGLQLEEPTLRLARRVSSSAVIVEIGDEVISPADYRYDFSFPESVGRPNPHLWTDPGLGKEYARVVARVMAEVDPAGAEIYERNLDAFITIVEEFDAALRIALDTVPADHRKLVTYHDAYAYWAESYGWTVVGAVEPTDFGAPSPKDIANLIEQIRDESVLAVFGSEIFPSPVLEQLASETGARYVADLRDDDLPGQPGDPDHSWLGLLRFDYVTIVDALGGDPSALRSFDVRNVGPDRASYPQ